MRQVSKFEKSTNIGIAIILTRMNILSGLEHLRSMRNCAIELGSTLLGIQNTQTKLTAKMNMSSMPETSRTRALGVNSRPSARTCEKTISF